MLYHRENKRPFGVDGPERWQAGAWMGAGLSDWYQLFPSCHSNGSGVMADIRPSCQTLPWGLLTGTPRHLTAEPLS